VHGVYNLYVCVCVFGGFRRGGLYFIFRTIKSRAGRGFRAYSSRRRFRRTLQDPTRTSTFFQDLPRLSSGWRARTRRETGENKSERRRPSRIVFPPKTSWTSDNIRKRLPPPPSSFVRNLNYDRSTSSCTMGGGTRRIYIYIYIYIYACSGRLSTLHDADAKSVASVYGAYVQPRATRPLRVSPRLVHAARYDCWAEWFNGRKAKPLKRRIHYLHGSRRRIRRERYKICPLSGIHRDRRTYSVVNNTFQCCLKYTVRKVFNKYIQSTIQILVW